MYKDRIYRKIKAIVEKRNTLKLNCLDKVNKEEYQRFMFVFNYCLNSLKEEYQKILLESYFDVKYQYWWIDYYCQSHFYRKRFKAVNSFVNLFEIVNENFANNSTSFTYCFQ